MKNHNEAKPQNDQLTISSREIADVTGKHHGHVMRDIRKMLSEFNEDEALYASTYQDRSGRPQPCFELDEITSLSLVNGYERQHVANFRSWLDKAKAEQTYTSKERSTEPTADLVEALIQQNKRLTEMLEAVVAEQQDRTTQLEHELRAVDARLGAATVYMTIAQYLSVFPEHGTRIDDEDFEHICVFQ